MPLPVKSQRMTSPAKGRPRERSLAVWGADNWVGDARDVVGRCSTIGNELRRLRPNYCGSLHLRAVRRRC